jgi:hypothetical protein
MASQLSGAKRSCAFGRYTNMVQMVLTIIASLLVGAHTPVHCSLPPDQTEWGYVVGWTYVHSNDTADIYLKNCDLSSWENVHVFGHEICHVLHPEWSEGKVVGSEFIEGRRVIRVMEGAFGSFAG